MTYTLKAQLYDQEDLEGKLDSIDKRYVDGNQSTSDCTDAVGGKSVPFKKLFEALNIGQKIMGLLLELMNLKHR